MTLIISKGLVLKQQGATPLLLDAYPGAAAAYSFRALSLSYNGPVIRIRRSSDNAESDFTATQVTNGTLATFCGAGNGFVRTWYDQSGSGRHATQTTTANQPQIVSSGSILTVNSKPALLFDGSNDSLSFSDLTLTTYSIFALIKKAATSSNFVTLGYSLSRYFSVSPWSEGFFYEGMPNDYARTGYTNNTAQNLFSVIKSTTGTGGWSGQQNGSDLGAYVQPTSYTGMVLSTIGRRSDGVQASGNMQELLLYGSAQTANRSAITANINANYAIF
jgi:hypothetical protein